MKVTFLSFIPHPTHDGNELHFVWLFSKGWAVRKRGEALIKGAVGETKTAHPVCGSSAALTSSNRDASLRRTLKTQHIKLLVLLENVTKIRKGSNKQIWKRFHLGEVSGREFLSFAFFFLQV